MTPAVNLADITLTVGSHKSWKHGACVMELAAYMADEPWSDHPACVSPVLGAFLRSWNDALDEETRQKLKPYAARVIGTAGDGHDETRAWLAVNWLCRVCAPAFLDLAGLTEDAIAFRALAPISPKTAKSAMPALKKGQKTAAATWAAARAAAGDAAGDAARAAARAAAWDAARDAARAAAWDALKATVLTLQDSAFTLLDRMISPEQED